MAYNLFACLTYFESFPSKCMLISYFILCPNLFACPPHPSTKILVSLSCCYSLSPSRLFRSPHTLAQSSLTFNLISLPLSASLVAHSPTSLFNTPGLVHSPLPLCTCVLSFISAILSHPYPHNFHK